MKNIFNETALNFHMHRKFLHLTSMFLFLDGLKLSHEYKPAFILTTLWLSLSCLLLKWIQILERILKLANWSSSLNRTNWAILMLRNKSPFSAKRLNRTPFSPSLLKKDWLLLWDEWWPPKRYVPILIHRTCECDLIWEKSLWRCN